MAILTQSTLIRVNPVTNDIEPRLATAWTPSADQLTWTFRLRDGVSFSDGAPFTSADVIFTFRALYDSRLESQMQSGFLVDGKPLAVHAVDDHTVTVTFPAPYGPNVRILDGLPILPQHKLATALADGTMQQAWGRSATAADVVGLGPFMLAENVPGQSIRFVRNPHYWATDPQGHRLPYLDEVDAELVPDQSAEALRLESADLDVPNDFIRPEDIAPMRARAAKDSLAFSEPGVGLDPSSLWFDLSAQSKAAKDRPWLQREEFRQAISLAVDRQAIADSVYLGLAVPIIGPTTPGFGNWYAADIPVPTRDLARAKHLLASAGLTSRPGEAVLRDAAGKPAQFTILSQKGRTDREQMAALVAEQLKAVGLDVAVVLLDPNSVIGHIMADDYDAVLFGTNVSSVDPSMNLQYWLSTGGFHLWNMHEAKAPATQWEAQVDDLMRRQMASGDLAERHRLFAEVQHVFAAHVPAIYFVSPKVTVAVTSRVHGVEPSILQPPVLWNVDRLSVSPRMP